MMPKRFDIRFANGHTAQAVEVEHEAALPAALAALELVPFSPVLVLVGGAGSLNDADLARLRPLFVEVLAPVVQEIAGAVIDGGTSAGVMRLMGEARTAVGGTFPLIGVAAVGTVVIPNGSEPPPGGAMLDRLHTHFVLVPGSEWGDEVAWLSRVAGALAAGSRSVTVLVSGGPISYKDVDESIHAGRQVLAIAGTGGTADALVAALGEMPPPARAREAVESGLLRAIIPDKDNLEALGALLRAFLCEEE